MVRLSRTAGAGSSGQFGGGVIRGYRLTRIADRPVRHTTQILFPGAGSASSLIVLLLEPTTATERLLADLRYLTAPEISRLVPSPPKAPLGASLSRRAPAHRTGVEGPIWALLADDGTPSTKGTFHPDPAVRLRDGEGRKWGQAVWKRPGIDVSWRFHVDRCCFRILKLGGFGFHPCPTRAPAGGAVSRSCQPGRQNRPSCQPELSAPNPPSTFRRCPITY